jgi:hypothetical protein
MVDHSRTDAPPLVPYAARSPDGIIATGSKIVKILPLFSFQPASLPRHPHFATGTSRFGSTHLDPFKNAMLESVAPEMSLPLNLCVLLPDPTGVAA